MNETRTIKVNEVQAVHNEEHSALKNVLLGVGWTLAVLAFFAVGGLAIWGISKANEVATLQAKLTEAEKGRAETDAKLKEIMDRIMRLEGSGALGGVQNANANGGDVTKQLMGMLSGVAGASNWAAQGIGPSIMSLFTGTNGKSISNISANMMVDMEYGDLLYGLQLPPDREQRAREIIARNMGDQIATGMGVFQTKASNQQLSDLKMSADQKLRRELGQVLNPNQLAAFDSYQRELPEHILGKSIEMQLSMFSGNLTPQNRKIAREVLVQELMGSGFGADGMGIPSTTDLSSLFQQQQIGLQRARARLSTVFSIEQLSQYDRFANQLSRMLQSASQLFSGAGGMASGDLNALGNLGGGNAGGGLGGLGSLLGGMMGGN